MAVLRGTMKGDRLRHNSDGVSHRLADRELTVRADTWRTFATLDMAKDGSGQLTVKRDGKAIIVTAWDAE